MIIRVSAFIPTLKDGDFPPLELKDEIERIRAF
jgi:hypothetical protein